MSRKIELEKHKMNYLLLVVISFGVVMVLGVVTGVIISIGKECEITPEPKK